LSEQRVACLDNGVGDYPLLRLIHHFNSIHASVALDGDEREHQLALGVGLESMEGFLQGPIRPTRLFEDIEILQKLSTITINIEQPPPRSALVEAAEIGFSEVERNTVLAFRHREGVIERAPTLPRLDQVADSLRSEVVTFLICRPVSGA